MTATLPHTMKALLLSEPRAQIEDAARHLCVSERPVPVPRRGEVLVRMSAAPCNPSDLMFLTSTYWIEKPMPAVPGFEGCGVVVRSGGGLLGKSLIGRRVACGGQNRADGTWAEYYVARADECFPLLDPISDEQGATLLLNPLTGYGLLDIVRRREHPAIIMNGAASQVGRYLNHFAAEIGYPVLNIVRREDQAAIVREAGGRHVIVTEELGAWQRAAMWAYQYGASAALDAVGGVETEHLLRILPNRGQLIAFGRLDSSTELHVRPEHIIIDRKSIEGFYLPDWIRQSGVVQLGMVARNIQESIIAGRISTTIREACSFDRFPGSIAQYAARMSDGKVVVRPSVS